MKLILKLLLFIFLSTPLLLIGFAYLSIEQEPLVEIEARSLSPHDIARAKRLLRQHDPRSLHDGQVKEVTLNNQELNLLGRHLTSRLGGRLITHLSDKALKLRSSFKIPAITLNRYLNLSITAVQEDNVVQLQSIKIGNLNLSSWTSNLIANQLLLLAKNHQPIQLFTKAFQSVEINQQRLTIRYQWNPELLNVAREQFITAKEQERLYRYQAQLIELSRGPNLPRTLSLDYYLSALFSFAKEHSKQGNAADENRAMLIVLGQHLSGRGHRFLFPETAHLHPVRKKIKLAGRRDFAQHFAISAALSAIGDSQFADLIGIQKELDDLSGSSGFSFTDLAADRAGNYLGKVATESEKSARAVQNFFQDHDGETSYMPSVKGLPEGLSARAFRTRFGSLGSQRFKQMERIIDGRLKKTPFYRQNFID